MAWLEETAAGLIISVTLRPRSSKNRILGIYNDTLKLAVTAPPVAGEANRACLKILGKILDLPASSLVIISGETARGKRVLVTGIDAGTATAKLLAG